MGSNPTLSATLQPQVLRRIPLVWREDDSLSQDSHQAFNCAAIPSGRFGRKAQVTFSRDIHDVDIGSEASHHLPVWLGRLISDRKGLVSRFSPPSQDGRCSARCSRSSSASDAAIADYLEEFTRVEADTAHGGADPAVLDDA